MCLERGGGRLVHILKSGSLGPSFHFFSPPNHGGEAPFFREREASLPYQFSM